MSHLYEPDADRQLDEGSEPLEKCSACGDELLPFEGSLCSNCIAASAACPDRIPDDEDEAAWLSRELQRYS